TKIVLFGLALALAAASRWRALGSDNLNMLRRLTSIEVVLVAGIVAISGLLAGTPPPALAATEATLLGPPPISGPTSRPAVWPGI
ncbi:MAG: hypothetical protein ACRDZM_17620, partial [Acidimicrobiia bacterium]